MSKKKHAEETSEQELEVNEASENEAEEAAAENAEAEETSEAPAEESADDKVKALEEELKKEKDNYMRLFAEFDNFRKRTSREKTEAYGDSAAKTIGAILPALDNFDRALDAPCEDENFKKGVEMIFTQMNGILEKLGVTEIEAVGAKFDPNLHNAIKQVESEDGESDIVCEVFQKGYKLGDRIIRPAMVAVTA
ncbi:MAG: nucleotide exchange factor GrpE [Oscillospiraceae bacterium]|nr:nucleotide exchange factor GrpE [Oscillospiraceae bacterium]MBP1591077.1 nucleotide exchange factor GrpE [Oscillospiraceae bacterium]